MYLETRAPNNLQRNGWSFQRSGRSGQSTDWTGGKTEDVFDWLKKDKDLNIGSIEIDSDVDGLTGYDDLMSDDGTEQVLFNAWEEKKQVKISANFYLLWRKSLKREKFSRMRKKIL